jgi:hypothetical protein
MEPDSSQSLLDILVLVIVKAAKAVFEFFFGP